MRHAVSVGQPVGDGSTTLGVLLDRWSSEVLPSQNLSPRTVAAYNWACTTLSAELGGRRLRTLRPEDVEKYFTSLATNGMSRSSLIKLRSVLNKALRYAERRSIVARNIATIVELPAIARRQEPGRALTVDQARALLDVARDDRLAALWTLMLYLGLRPGEATGLSWTDIDLDNGIVHVRRSLKIEHGQLVVDEHLKTTRSRRSLDIPTPALDALRRHRDHQADEADIAGKIWFNQYELVFTTNVGTPINPSNLRRDFAKLTQAAGLGRWHPHELRHSAASLLSAAGVPLERIADVLGHDGTRMTALVYRHAITPTIDAAKILERTL